MAKKNQFEDTAYEDVKARKTSDYPFLYDTKKKYHVLIDDGNDYFVEGFDNKKEANAFVRKASAKNKVYLK